jgi:hypothetical protein
MAFSLGPSGLVLNSETMGNYEEGQWQVYLYNSASGGTSVGGGTVGYIRVGDLVTLHGQAQLGNASSILGGSPTYINLPFTPRNYGGQNSSDLIISTWDTSLNMWEDGYPSISMTPGAGRHPFFRHAYNGADHMTGSHWGNTGRIQFNNQVYMTS